MIEAFKSFTFEAAHEVAPHSTLHGHTFTARAVFIGAADPVYGWCVSLDDVNAEFGELKALLDEKHLNKIPGLECPSLENVARFIFNRLAKTLPTLDSVSVERGPQGAAEGCIYRARPRAAA